MIDKISLLSKSIIILDYLIKLQIKINLKFETPILMLYKKILK